ncbi:MAG TPA: acyl-CoA dehydrogenase family protein [Streptosporangiaceae bacterium]|nr:acyl-CoA dehydrogenase family protein [Streptosporangiaceae bacterium]
MRFDLTDDQRILQSATADFLEKFCPVSATRALHEAGRAFDRDIWRHGAELGWTSLIVPEEAGGGSVSGDGLADATLIAEQFGRLAAPGPFVVGNVVAAALAQAANAGAHSGLLGRLMTGEAIGTWACCPPAGGWDPVAGAIEAVADGDGYRLTGVHDRVEAACDADVFLVVARTADGLTQFVVPAGAAGLSVSPLATLDLTRGFGRVGYDGVRVPGTAVVGTPGGAAAAAAVERQFQIAVVLQCAELAGAVEKVLEFTAQWMSDRFSFGRPLASYQALKHRFADMTLWSHAAQATTAAAAAAVQQRHDDAAELVSVAKSYVGQRATDIIQDCVQLHGGLGVTWDHDIHIYLRRATVDRVTWGTPSEHRRRVADLLNV